MSKEIAELKKLLGKALETVEKMETSLQGNEQEETETEGRILYWSDDEDDFTNLDEMNMKELKKFAKDNEIELTAKKLDDVRDEIYEAFMGDEGESDEDVEDEEEEEDVSDAPIVTIVNEDDDEEEVDLSEKTLPQLKKFAKEYGVEVSAKVAKDKDALIEAILEAFQEEAEEEDEDGDDEFDPREAYGINDLDDDELAEILTENGLSVKGKRQALEDRLIKAIEDGTIELEEGED